MVLRRPLRALQTFLGNTWIIEIMIRIIITEHKAQGVLSYYLWLTERQEDLIIQRCLQTGLQV
jgi:hypothetical protein